MYGRCLYSSRDSFLSVIDHLPTSCFSSSSLHFTLKFTPSPPPPPPRHAQNVTHLFLQPVRLPLSFLHHSSLHRFLCFIKCPRCNQTSHTLAAIGEVTVGRKCTVSRSGRPSAAAVTPGEKVKAADNGGGGGHVSSFTIPTWGGDIKHPPVLFRRVIGRVRSKLQRYINQISDNQFLLV